MSLPWGTLISTIHSYHLSNYHVSGIDTIYSGAEHTEMVVCQYSLTVLFSLLPVKWLDQKYCTGKQNER